jgi:hypothetical protein
VVEGGGLENRCAERHRGFESYLLRQKVSYWRGGRVAEGARLLSECRVISSTEGSNPSLSAIQYKKICAPVAQLDRASDFGSEG